MPTFPQFGHFGACFATLRVQLEFYFVFAQFVQGFATNIVRNP
jgi:hypothetical protein